MQRPPPPPRGVWDKLLRDPNFFRLRRAKITPFLGIFDRFLPILGLDFFSILTPLFLYQIISDYPIELSIVRSDLPGRAFNAFGDLAPAVLLEFSYCIRVKYLVYQSIPDSMAALRRLETALFNIRHFSKSVIVPNPNFSERDGISFYGSIFNASNPLEFALFTFDSSFISACGVSCEVTNRLD